MPINKFEKPRMVIKPSCTGGWECYNDNNYKGIAFGKTPEEALKEYERKFPNEQKV